MHWQNPSAGRRSSTAVKAPSPVPAGSSRAPDCPTGVSTVARIARGRAHVRARGRRPPARPGERGRYSSRGQVLTRDFNALRSLIVHCTVRYSGTRRAFFSELHPQRPFCYMSSRMTHYRYAVRTRRPPPGLPAAPPLARALLLIHPTVAGGDAFKRASSRCSARRRRRWVGGAQSTMSEEAVAAAAEPPPKRRRGRPRKDAARHPEAMLYWCTLRTFSTATQGPKITFALSDGRGAWVG
eukprot:COSAG03_NODE_844_length_5650_cov_2.078184_2_plen_240_part_00